MSVTCVTRETQIGNRRTIRMQRGEKGKQENRNRKHRRRQRTDESRALERRAGHFHSLDKKEEEKTRPVADTIAIVNGREYQAREGADAERGATTSTCRKGEQGWQ